MSGEKQKYPRRDPTTAHRTVADEGCLVVVPKRSVVEVLNPVAGKIYSMLDGTHTADDIVRAVVEEFDVKPDQAHQDLEAFLDELRNNEMLVTAGGNGGNTGEAASD